MPERFYDPLDGNDAADGLTHATRRKLIPGTAGATAVTTGDIISVLNGSLITARIVMPANNLLYRGYGVAPNVLVLKLPATDVRDAISLRVAREWGVHEGMWTIDASANDLSGGAGISLGTRTGCVIEDVDVIGPAVGTRDAVGLASSADNTSGFTMRRFRIRGATQRGIAAYIKSVLLEWGQVWYTQDDNIGLMASTANGYRAGGSSVLRYLDLGEPNKASASAPTNGTVGDCLQTVMSSAAAEWNEALLVHDIHYTKNSSAKQIVTLADASAGITHQRFRVAGSGANQIVHGNLRGALRIRYGHWADEYAASNDNTLVRFEGITTPSIAYGMQAGSLLDVSFLTATVGRAIGVYHCTEVVAAWDFNGTIRIRNNTVVGQVNDNAFTFAANLAAFWSTTSLTTYGASFQLDLANNCVQIQNTAKPNVILPPGQAGDARWVVRGNRVPLATYRAGNTEYADLAAFQAAHAPATGNTSADALLSTSLQPKQSSPLLAGGADLGPVRDARGWQGRKFIGAYAAVPLRA